MVANIHFALDMEANGELPELHINGHKKILNFLQKEKNTFPYILIYVVLDKSRFAHDGLLVSLLVHDSSPSYGMYDVDYGAVVKLGKLVLD